MKSGDLRGMADGELLEALQSARDEQFRTRLQHHTGQVVNTAQIKDAKRNIARILTVMTERRQQAEAGQ